MVFCHGTMPNLVHGETPPGWLSWRNGCVWEGGLPTLDDGESDGGPSAGVAVYANRIVWVYNGVDGILSLDDGKSSHGWPSPGWLSALTCSFVYLRLLVSLLWDDSSSSSWRAPAGVVVYPNMLVCIYLGVASERHWSLL